MTSKKFYQPENWTFGCFKSKAGSYIRFGHVLPKGPSRGTVVVTGGYNRPIEYYFETINNWLDRGYAVYAMDWYGQGGSSREKPEKPDIPATCSFKYHVRDFDQFVTEIVKPAQDKPAFLCSHSMGGNIMLRYLYRHRDNPDMPFTAAILGAPLIEVNTHIMPRKTFERAVKRLDINGMKHMKLPQLGKHFNRLAAWFIDGARDWRLHKNKGAARVAAHEHFNQQVQDKGLSIGDPTMGWLRAAMKSADKLQNKNVLEQIRVPVLILSTDHDSLVCIKAQKKAANRLPAGLLRTFKDACHGIWYDGDKTQKKIWRAIDKFIAGIANPGTAAPETTQPKHT